ncbi:MAG: hypothetical protein M3Z95_08880, partial [Actinomycetota bacterium]|nr:hypothetical protein [Actinomycetota bacterium]
VLAQLLLPGIAASRIASRMRRYGGVQSVSVTAWPAVKLLWERADSVTVKAVDLKVSPAQAAKLVWEGRGASSIQMTAQSARVGRLRLREVSLRKRGDSLTGEGMTTAADVRAALPEGFAVQLVGSAGGVVEVKATGALFGVGASVDAVAGPSEGKLVAHPLGLLLGGLQLTLFADRHVHVDGVGASAVSGPGGEPGYRLTMSARLR